MDIKFASKSLISHRACCYTCYTIQLMQYSKCLYMYINY